MTLIVVDLKARGALLRLCLQMQASGGKRALRKSVWKTFEGRTPGVIQDDGHRRIEFCDWRENYFSPAAVWVEARGRRRRGCGAGGISGAA